MDCTLLMALHRKATLPPAGVAHPLRTQAAQRAESRAECHGPQDVGAPTALPCPGPLSAPADALARPPPPGGHCSCVLGQSVSGTQEPSWSEELSALCPWACREGFSPRSRSPPPPGVSPPITWKHAWLPPAVAGRRDPCLPSSLLPEGRAQI